MPLLYTAKAVIYAFQPCARSTEMNEFFESWPGIVGALIAGLLCCIVLWLLYRIVRGFRWRQKELLKINRAQLFSTREILVLLRTQLAKEEEAHKEE
jgi:hypothetical protein